MYKICKHQLDLSFSSPKIYLSLILGSIVHLILLMPLFEFSQNFQKPLSVYEGFIYFNCDIYSATTGFLGILLLMSDIPFTSEIEIYTLLRTNKRTWCCGKILYLLVMCTIYYTIIAIVGMIYLAENSYLGNVWSEPITAMVKYPDAESVINSNVFFPYQHIISEMSPVSSFICCYILSVCYAFMMCLLVFFLNLKYSAKTSYAIVMILHISGYILTAIMYSPVYIKFSLLGQSMLMHHSIGELYQGLYPELWQSFFLFGGIALVLIVLIRHQIQKYQFNITVGVYK